MIEYAPLIMVGVVFLLLLLGYPVALTLAGTALLSAFVGVITGTFEIAFLNASPNRLFGIISNQTLIAVPLFILMRALGIISDKLIIQYCLLDLDKYEDYIDLFVPCVHDAGVIFTQELALQYIKMFTKGKTIPHALEILANYLLPHVGELNFKPISSVSKSLPFLDVNILTEQSFSIK